MNNMIRLLLWVFEENVWLILVLKAKLVGISRSLQSTLFGFSSVLMRCVAIWGQCSSVKRICISDYHLHPNSSEIAE